jgi:coproporphyrinogen III oxidase-like Fe-S oxidoreductase
MLRLRLADGVSFADFTARWGGDARRTYADPLARLSHLRLLDVNADRFALSERGLAVADAVAAEFLRT